MSNAKVNKEICTMFNRSSKWLGKFEKHLRTLSIRNFISLFIFALLMITFFYYKSEKMDFKL